jgi:phage replication O-like protein O
MTTSEQATFPGFQFPNTTQIPNEVFDTLMSHLSGGELKVLLYICRRTFGFRKDSDHISLSQISKGITTKADRVLDQGTGLSKRQVQRALRALEGRQIILVERKVDETGLHEINTYRLNVRGSEKMSPPVETPVSGEVGTRMSLGVETPASTTKQREQKKEEQNKDNDDGVFQALEQFGMTPAAIPSLLERYPAAYIREKLAMTRRLLADGSGLVTKNPVGWLRRAIEGNYQPPRHKGRLPSLPRTNRQQPPGMPQKQQREQGFIFTSPVELPQPDRQTQSVWEHAVEHLQSNLPAGETPDRFTDTLLIEVTDTKAVIFVPDHTVAVWLERRLYLQIAKALKEVVGKELDLQFVYPV